MIAVSDSFKKAIKSDVREIHGYVDVTYDKKEGDYLVDTIPIPLALSKSDGSDLIDNVKIMKNYATLENNYLLLDGSFILANKNTLEDSGGFISNDIYSNMSDNVFNIVSEESGYVTTKGFTIFFKDNIVFDFDIHILTEYGSGGTEDTVLDIPVRNNTRYNYLYTFEEETTIKEFQITILNVEFQDRRIRIPDVNFSLTDVYQNEDLVSFEVNEEMDINGESLPVNTCTIKLNNYPDEYGNVMFDPLSPTGITKYLTNNCTLEPYIGVLTEENGIEYVPMGFFYLKSWDSDNDGNVTFTCDDVVSKYENTIFTSDGHFLNQYYTLTEMGNYLTNMTGFVFDFPNTGSVANYWLAHNTLKEWLLGRLPRFVSRYSNNNYIPYNAYVNRNNVFVVSERNTNVIDNISQHNLLEDITYKTNQKVNKVIINDINDRLSYGSSKTNAIKDTRILTSTEEYVWYINDKYMDYDNATFSYTSTNSSKATLIDRNGYMLYVKFTGTVGSSVTITYNTYTSTDESIKNYEFTNNIKDGLTINMDFHDYFNMSEELVKDVANFYLNNFNPNSISVKTLGDPSLEVGDTINIQTRYNGEYKKVVITKQKFTYDGGLTCDLEGRGD